MQKFRKIIGILMLVTAVVVIGLIAAFEHSILTGASDLISTHSWIAAAAGLLFLILTITGIVSNIHDTEGTLFGNGFIQLAVLELFLCAAALGWYRYHLQQPGRIVLRLAAGSTETSVRLSMRSSSAADTVAAPADLPELPAGTYTFEILDPDMIAFRSEVILGPAATETLLVPAGLNTRKLSVRTEPSGVEIWINGLLASLTPDTFDVLAGDTVFLALKKPDYLTRLDTLVMHSETDLGTVQMRKLHKVYVSPEYDYTTYLIYDHRDVLVYSSSGPRRLQLPEGNYRLAWEIGEGQYRTKSFLLDRDTTVPIP